MTVLELAPDPVKVRAEKRHPSAHGRPDDFQTPAHALNPLFPFLPQSWHIWEPSCGKGNLVRAFEERGYQVTGSDILDGRDFRNFQPPAFDAIVTNPPFSLKDEFLTRAYALGRPFAFLLPLTALESRARQNLYRRFGVDVVFLPSRIHFETPTGRTDGTSWFATCWITHGLNLPSQMYFWTPEQESPSPQGELF